MRMIGQRFATVLLGVLCLSSVDAKVLSARVDDLGDLYQIVLVFERQSLIPLDPDRGFFPKIRSEDRFVAWGEGQIVTLHGHVYRRFEIGHDVRSMPDNCVYRSGELLLSEASGELIIRARLSNTHSQYTNRSGRYRDVVFSHFVRTGLSADSNLGALGETYVEATGHFDDDKRAFVLGDRAFPAMDLCNGSDDGTLKILAHVVTPRAPSEPYLFVLRKNDQSGPMCCPWGE